MEAQFLGCHREALPVDLAGQRLAGVLAAGLRASASPDNPSSGRDRVPCEVTALPPVSGATAQRSHRAHGLDDPNSIFTAMICDVPQLPARGSNVEKVRTVSLTARASSVPA